ncbi:hypothetical protein [Streptomyces sp. R41]|uniref:AI-2E family transporter n=1 Tax=Streptomyces sp. R41 TaxID=3238632 RepID=A0AB39RWB5_9ACTN
MGILLAALFGGPVGAFFALLAVILLWLLGHWIWTAWLAPLLGGS